VDAHDAADLVAEAASEAGATVVGITGGVAAGKSTLAEAVAARLGAPVVATDGFLHPNAVLADLELTARKGFPESFDSVALRAALDGWRADGRATVPVYSHLLYDVVPPPVEVAGERLVVEGLHLGHPVIGVRDRIDLLVHIDADDGLLATWFLERFRELRLAAADEPTAFLHPIRDLPAETAESMAMGVWEAVNLVVLEEEVRPWAKVADLVLTLGPSHEVVAATTN
jgi:type I pantothenate kinase